MEKSAFIDLGLVTGLIKACCEEKARSIIEAALEAAFESMPFSATISELKIELVEPGKGMGRRG